jgi:hypothetical protein
MLLSKRRLIGQKFEVCLDTVRQLMSSPPLFTNPLYPDPTMSRRLELASNKKNVLEFERYCQKEAAAHQRKPTNLGEHKRPRIEGGQREQQNDRCFLGRKGYRTCSNQTASPNCGLPKWADVLTA